MSGKRSKFEGLFEEQENQGDQPVPPAEQSVPSTHTDQEEILEPRNQERKKSRKEEGVAPRIKTNYEIRQDYVHAMKRVALDDGRKIYEVLEDAIAQYLEQRQLHKPS